MFYWCYFRCTWVITLVLVSETLQTAFARVNFQGHVVLSREDLNHLQSDEGEVCV